MAVSLLPGRIPSCNSSSVAAGSNALRNSVDGGCPCRVMSTTMASLLARDFLSSEAGPSSSSSPSSFSSYDFLYSIPIRRLSCFLSGGDCFRKKAAVSAAFGQEFRESGSYQKRRVRARRASATKDTSSRREVLPQTNRNGNEISPPPQRFPSPRNDKTGEELRGETEVKDEEERIVSGDNAFPREEAKSELLEPELSSETHSASKQGNAEGQKEEENVFSGSATLGTIAAGLGLVAVLGGFGALGFFYKDQINAILIQFSDFLEGYGPAGYGLFILVYAGLEVLAIPAIPLTMSAGLLFGTAIGTIIVSIAGTIAATVAFLIARYLARDRILEMAKNNKKFLAIDKAIGEDGFRVVTLLRLSPLLPFSLGNYLYGLTSVKLAPYVMGSWLGMLPGTWAYVSAGAIGRAFIRQESEQLWTGGPEQLWTLGLGLAVTIFAATYVTRLAKEALKDIE